MEKTNITFSFLGTEGFKYICLQGNVTQGPKWNEISKHALKLLLLMLDS